jgi:hypothetical protein
MPVTVPTVQDAQALLNFLIERTDEEWQAIHGDPDTDPEAQARFYRISNSNKLALNAAAQALVDLLDHDDTEQAALAWHRLTAAGEEWRDHPDYLPAFENLQRAQIRQQLGV